MPMSKSVSPPKCPWSVKFMLYFSKCLLAKFRGWFFIGNKSTVLRKPWFLLIYSWLFLIEIKPFLVMSFVNFHFRRCLFSVQIVDSCKQVKARCDKKLFSDPESNSTFNWISLWIFFLTTYTSAICSKTISLIQIWIDFYCLLFFSLIENSRVMNSFAVVAPFGFQTFVTQVTLS